jgi:hypothetical protein
MVWQASVDETSKITGGKLDYIIANAGLVSSWSAYDPLSVLYVNLFTPGSETLLTAL